MSDDTARIIGGTDDGSRIVALLNGEIEPIRRGKQVPDDTARSCIAGHVSAVGAIPYLPPAAISRDTADPIPADHVAAVGAILHDTFIYGETDDAAAAAESIHPLLLRCSGDGGKVFAVYHLSPVIACDTAQIKYAGNAYSIDATVNNAIIHSGNTAYVRFADKRSFYRQIFDFSAFPDRINQSGVMIIISIIVAIDLVRDVDIQTLDGMSVSVQHAGKSPAFRHFVIRRPSLIRIILASLIGTDRHPLIVLIALCVDVANQLVAGGDDVVDPC